MTWIYGCKDADQTPVLTQNLRQRQRLQIQKQEEEKKSWQTMSISMYLLRIQRKLNGVHVLDVREWDKLCDWKS